MQLPLLTNRTWPSASVTSPALTFKNELYDPRTIVSLSSFFFFSSFFLFLFFFFFFSLSHFFLYIYIFCIFIYVYTLKLKVTSTKKSQEEFEPNQLSDSEPTHQESLEEENKHYGSPRFAPRGTRPHKIYPRPDERQMIISGGKRWKRN